ncbi:CDP-glycerol glycerophosphotransferase family protein [Enterovibrio norvegicus]|uniref:CDP-glycerol glycerophosphotransferase family protein n=1 Tax=Enterovibrio norvegicus TaxID=188144 RepID=UPI003D14D530
MKNKNKYIISRLMELILGIIPSIFSLFLKRDKDIIIFNSQFNTTFEHNAKALFLYYRNFATSNMKAYYVVNDPILRSKLSKTFGDSIITNNRFQDIFIILSAKTWVCSSLETPIGGFFHRVRRNVIHLGHGAPIKCVGLNDESTDFKKKIYYALNRTNFSHFLSSSNLFDDGWAKCLDISLDRIIRGAQARNDSQVKSLDEQQCFYFKGSSKRILYAPTWRPFSDTILFPFADMDSDRLHSFLLEHNLCLYLRVHPNFESEIDKNFLGDNVRVLSKQSVPDINSILFDFDMLVTDYSSIYVDYLLTEKPLIFIPYDYEEYRDHVGFSIDYQGYTPGPKPNTLNDFLDEIDRLLNCESYYSNERFEANKKMNEFTTGHAKQNEDLITKILGDQL